MGNNCFETAIVTGYNRVPDPPASIIPFLLLTFFLRTCVSRQSRKGPLSLSTNAHEVLYNG